MAYRRKIIDRRTREGRKLGAQVDTLKGFGVLALVVVGIVGAISGKDKPSQPGQASDETFIAPAKAASSQKTASLQTTTSSVRPPQANGYVPFDDASANHPDGAPMTMATNAIPSQRSPEMPTVVAAPSLVPWRHVTGSGVRWSLRRVNGVSLLLVVDLGSDQVANVSVAPAFESLDLAAMNLRVDSLRSIIGQSFPLRTANYSYERDGGIRQLQ